MIRRTRAVQGISAGALMMAGVFASGCGGGQKPPPALTITTVSLVNGQVGEPYSATLTASGGTAPYSWSLTSGILPANLSLAASGAFSGTPAATVSSVPLTFTVTDSSKPVQTQTAKFTLTITPAPLTVSTASLPNGQVGANYQATLTAAGGTAPYTWALTGGTLPEVLAVDASGTISGTPMVTASATPLTFTVTDSGSPAQTQSATLPLTIAAASAAVSVYPRRAGLTPGQTLTLIAATTDGAAVTWSVAGSGCAGSACGSFSTATSASSATVTFTAAAIAGEYTLTATDSGNKNQAATVAVAVTGLGGVLTYHNDAARDGANTQEYALAPATVTAATFGKLFSCTVDGAIYAQPLWAPNLTVASARHNVVFVATQHDSVYAFDADASPCMPLWHANLLDAAHGGTAGETSVPNYTGNQAIGAGYFDIAPEVGVTGTPVIDVTTGTLYVVSKSANAGLTAFYQRLHVIDLTTGKEKFSGPVTIAATFPGTQDGGTTDAFAARGQNQRAGLVLSNGVVYIAWASHEDNPPYYGWVMGYDATTLAQVSVFNDTPNAGWGGIWMSGAAPAVDAAGNLYVLTGNGNFDANSASAPNNDYGDSLLQFDASLKVAQSFTPTDQQEDNDNDADFGSGGALVLADLPVNGTNPTHLIIGGGKDGTLYMNNRDRLGGLGDANAWQKLNVGSSIFAMGAYWNGTYFVAPAWGNLQAYSLNATTAQLTARGAASSAEFGFPGSTPSLSSMPDNSKGIVWSLDNSQYCTPQSPGCGPAILHAWEAGNLANELWNSTEGSGNTAGYAVKFAVPTVANGKVYVGTRGNNTGSPDSSTSTPGELDVYGLLPN
ncbi:MAG: putative Ig domain-containing protein [Acidobacteriaceae bacterium]